MPNIVSFNLDDDADTAALLINALVEYALTLDQEADESERGGRTDVSQLRRLAGLARGYAAICEEADSRDHSESDLDG